MTAFVCVPAFGSWAITLTWALWWIDVVISVACCMFLPFAMYVISVFSFSIAMHCDSHQRQSQANAPALTDRPCRMYIHTSPSLQTMTAVWLLPVVSTIVAAASGGIVAEVLPNPQHALWTVITSYILWGTGVPLAMVILVMYFHRLTVHRLPPREIIVSVFLPLGPLGQGGFAIMQLGKVAWTLFPQTNSLRIGESGKILYVVGFGLALVMWGYGLVWLFFALASISRSKFPFNMVRLTVLRNNKARLTYHRVGGDLLSQLEFLLSVPER